MIADVITPFSVLAYGTMGLALGLSVFRLAVAAQAARWFGTHSRYAAAASLRVGAQTMPTLLRPLARAATAPDAAVDLADFDDWITREIDRIADPDRHALTRLRHVIPQLGLFFTIAGIILGIAAAQGAGNEGARAFLATLPPALISTAMAAVCLVILYMAETRLDRGAADCERALGDALRRMLRDREGGRHA